MDKIDRLLEEVSLLQRLKQLKQRVFKSGSAKKTSNKIDKKEESLVSVNNDPCSKKIAADKSAMKRLTASGAVIKINCVKANSDFMSEMTDRVGDCVKTKNKSKLLQDLKRRYVCFNNDDDNFWIYDNKNKEVLYRHHEWYGEQDEFNAPKKDLSFEELINDLDPKAEIKKDC